MITLDHADDILEGICKDAGADGAMLVIFGGGPPGHAFSTHITNTTPKSMVIQALKRVIVDLEKECRGSMTDDEITEWIATGNPPPGTTPTDLVRTFERLMAERNDARGMLGALARYVTEGAKMTTEELAKALKYP